MDIAQQLAEKYPGIFDPLIEAYEKSIFGDRVNTRPRKIIEKLLDRDGEIISMYLQGENLKDIADLTELSTEEIQKILKTYDKRNITQFGLSEKALAFRAERIQNAKIEELREKVECLAQQHPGVFEPLIDISNNIDNGDIETYKKISKAVKSLGDARSNHGEILSLRYEGFSLQEIGDKFTITRERVRQIIKKYEGLYTVVGTKEWCLRQLDKLSDPQEDVRIFPSNQELNACHLKLEGSIKEHFTSGEFGKLSERDRLEIVKKLGFDIVEEVKQHSVWSEERLIYEVREVAKQLGKPDLMPMQKELTELGRQDLRGTIGRFGGQSQVAKLTGLIYQGQTVGEDGRRTYWTDEKIRAFLYDAAEKEGHPGCMPTQAECAKYHPKGTVVSGIFTKNGKISWPELAQKHGLKYDLSFQPVTLAYVKSFVKSLGDSLYNLTPAEIYVLFEQQRINKAGVNEFRERTFDNLVSVIQSGNLPREEIEKWLDNQPSDLADALLDPNNKTIEEAFRKVSKPLVKSDHKTKIDNPDDQEYQEDIEYNLPASSAGDTLKSLSVTTDILINSSSDQEAIDFLIAKAKAKLWKRCFEDEQGAIAEAQSHEGNVYSEAVRDVFIEEYTRCQQIPLPEG